MRRALVLGSALLLLVTAASAAPGVKISTAKFANVFYGDERKPIAITVQAEPDQPLVGTLDLRALDAYGTEALALTAPISVAPSETQARTVDLQSPLNGLFTLRAMLVRPDGSTAFEDATTLGVVPRPKNTGFDDRSAVGYYVFPTPGELSKADQIARQLQDFGVKWVRLNYSWADGRTERPDTSQPGWLDTTSLEAWVDAYRAHGVQVMVQLSGVARWASSRANETGFNEYGLGPIWLLSPPRDMADWEFFTRTIVMRLAGRVAYWEVQNEPDGSIYWMGTPEQYAALVRSTKQIMHAVDPDSRLVVNFIDAYFDGFEEVLFSQVGASVDVFGYHYFDRAEPTREMLARHDLVKPYWNTEAYGDTFAWTGEDRMFSHWFVHRAAGAERLFHFVYNLGVDDSDRNFIAKFGRYPVNPDYTPRAHAIGLRTLSDLVGRARFRYTYAADRTGSLKGYVFSEGKRTVTAIVRGDAAAWGVATGLEAIFRLPARYRRIVVTDLMGNRSIVEARRRRVRISLEGNPVFVEGIHHKDARRLRLRELRQR